MSENYFDIDEENAVHDAYLMIHDEDCEYDNMAEIIINETNLSAVVGHDLE